MRLEGEARERNEEEGEKEGYVSLEKQEYKELVEINQNALQVPKAIKPRIAHTQKAKITQPAQPDWFPNTLFLSLIDFPLWIFPASSHNNIHLLLWYWSIYQNTGLGF